MMLEANLSTEEMIQSLIDDLKSWENHHRKFVNHYRKLRQDLEEILRNIEKRKMEAEG